MPHQLVTLGTDAKLHGAIAIFDQNRNSCIPIVYADNLPVGIGSWRDLLEAIRPQRPPG